MTKRLAFTINPFENTKWINLYNNKRFRITGFCVNIKTDDPDNDMSVEYFYHMFINKDCWVNKNLYQKYLKDVAIFTLLDKDKYKEFEKFIFRIFQTKPSS